MAAMQMLRWNRAERGAASCACCNRVIKDGEPVQVIRVKGAAYGRVRQVTKLTCIAQLVDGMVETEKDKTRHEFEEIRRSLAEGLRYV